MYSQKSRSEKPAVKRFFSSVYLAAIGSLLHLGLQLLHLSDPSNAGPSVPGTGEKSNEILVLLWVHPFYVVSPLPDCFREYQISGCRLTDDRNVYSEADLVLFHHRCMLTGRPRFPTEPRPPAQKWVWMNFESPFLAPKVKKYEGVYNFTLNYREDSDIAVPYGFVIPNAIVDKVHWGHDVYPLDPPDGLPRPHLVAWVASHYTAALARVAFADVLKQYIQVDLFGKAGKPLGGDRDGLVKLLKQYRFYLAMENSQHTDYITEKLWNALLGGTIPVVLGTSRQNYERFLPPEAFIHVDDFATVKDLAEYMLKVQDSPALIEWHLSWRKSYSIFTMFHYHVRYCMACRKAIMTKGKRHQVKSLTEWFYS